MDNRTLNSIATQKPPGTSKPSNSLSAKRMIAALITNKNKPKVTIVIGSVNMTKIGFKMAFKMANTTATIIADRKLATSTPGKNLANTITAIAVSNSLIIKFMIFYFYEYKYSEAILTNLKIY